MDSLSAVNDAERSGAEALSRYAHRERTYAGT